MWTADIPENYQPRLNPITAETIPLVSSDDIESAFQLLLTADRPLVVIGKGIFYQNVRL